jgi:hypothetical protein
MIGIITLYIVVTKAERLGKAKAVQLGNRDWAIAIITTNTKGDIIPPYILVKGVIAQAHWVTTTN